jgi:hypothetical protein
LTFLAAIFLFLYLSFFSERGANDIDTVSSWKSVGIPEGKRGDARTCPICAARFQQGDNVKSKIFPPSGRDYRLLHISGCKYCLGGERKRLCIVCGAELSTDDYLVAHIRQHPVKPDVRVQGCVHCMMGVKHDKKVKKLR